MSPLRVRVRSAGKPYAVTASDGMHRWPADEPPELGGANQGPTPEALLLSGLGACTAITVRMYAARKGWPLAEVEVDLTLSGNPGQGTAEIRRTLAFRGALDAAQERRLLEIACACPLHKLIAKGVPIHTAAGSAAVAAAERRAV